MIERKNHEEPPPPAVTPKQEIKEQPEPSPEPFTPNLDGTESNGDIMEHTNTDSNAESKEAEKEANESSQLVPYCPDGNQDFLQTSETKAGRLQEVLRASLEANCGGDLDTMYISRRVRELLSVHNIGQRVFAKHVLGLSQGTVSELLSKPKLWDKLTEKGRDSYRKMYAWAADEQAVILLKGYVPRRGKFFVTFFINHSSEVCWHVFVWLKITHFHCLF